MALAGITLLAALLRLPWLEADSLWFDEAATWWIADRPFAAMWADALRDNYPPLYTLITWATVHLFGSGEWVLRLPAALFGVALVPMVYVLGARCGGRTAGLIAALLIALSAFHVWYSLEARMYSLLALASCAYSWAALRDLQQPNRQSAALLVGIGIALLLSHPYGALNWFAVSVVALWQTTQRGRLLRLLIVMLAAFLPFAVALFSHAMEITAMGFWIPAPTPAFLLQQGLALTSALLPGLIAGAIAALVPSRAALRSSALPILVALTLGPAILGYLASLATRPILIDRYLIGTLPALVVLAAIGITRWPIGRWGATAVAAIVALAGGLSLVFAAPPHRPDWRAAATDVAAKARPGDCIAVHPAYDTYTWRYHMRDPDCLEDEHSLPAALDRPLPDHLFFAVDTDWLERAAPHLALVQSRMQLTATTQFPRVVLYEFTPKP
jgi:uncharacterized membrane protein